jgi:hypothetical protein
MFIGNFVKQRDPNWSGGGYLTAVCLWRSRLYEAFQCACLLLPSQDVHAADNEPQSQCDFCDARWQHYVGKDVAFNGGWNSRCKHIGEITQPTDCQSDAQDAGGECRPEKKVPEDEAVEPDASPSIIPEGAMANGAKSPPTMINK